MQTSALWIAFGALIDRIQAEIQEIKNADLILSNVTPPDPPEVSVQTVSGNLNGDYYYVVSYVTATGETDASLESLIVSPANQQVDISFSTSADPSVIARNIYRTPGNGFHRKLYLVATINDNTTTSYLDNIADASLGVAVHRVNSTGGRILRDGAAIMSADRSSTVLGVGALANGTGYANTAIGVTALSANSDGGYNVAVGINSMLSNTTGSQNAALGVDSLASNITGSDNISIGNASMLHNTTGNENAGIGTRALSMNVNGSYNTALGGYALGLNSSGMQNTAIGSRAGQSNDTGNFNTALGQSALQANSTGSNNVGLGFMAGAYETGSKKVFVDGLDRTDESGGRTKSLLYGVLDAVVANQLLTINAGVVTINGALRFPGGGATYDAYLSHAASFPDEILLLDSLGGTAWNGRIKLRTSNNGGALASGIEISGAQAVKFPAYGAGTITSDASGNLTSVSDERLKIIHGKFSMGLAEVLGIHPILYSWHARSGMETEHVYAGLSAQNVQEHIPEAVGMNKDGFRSLDDRALIAALINAVGELNAKVELLQSALNRPG